MSASSPRIIGRGDLATERVGITVDENCDLSFLLLIDTKHVDDGSIEVGSLSAYWFGGQQVEAGDQVVVYTKVGKDSTQARKDGHKNHFIYRGEVTPRYADPRACVVLATLGDWMTSPLRKLT